MRRYKVLDIFSGAGGMSEGFLRAGFSIPYASDISTQAMETYVNRHNQLGYRVNFLNDDLNNIINNVETINLLKREKFDVVVGGPPCQGFSNAGKRKQEDNRNMLVKSYVRLISDLKPKYFVMENVTGILSFKYDSFEGVSSKIYTEEKIVDILNQEFDFIGYNTNIVVLNAADYGVPQNRKRVFILGNRKDLNSIKTPLPIEKKVTVKQALSDICGSKRLSLYQRDSRHGRTPSIDGNPIKEFKYLNNEKSNHQNLTVERFSLFRQGESFTDVCSRISEDEIRKYNTNKNSCRRLIENKQAYTVVTLPDDYIHYKENRILSVREMARLQSFDDSFEFIGKRTTGGKRRKVETPQYTMVGNAVPPLLSYAVACKVMEALNNE